MRAQLIEQFGGPEVVSWGEVDDPTPGEGEALVQMTAFGLNWAEIMEREGRYPGQHQPPMILGHNVTGVVVGHGPGVSEPPIGARVYGLDPLKGVCGELAALPARWLYEIPAGWDDVQAAASIATYLTAEVAIERFAFMQPGDSVLIHAAAGGLGSACLQLARAHGAGTIIATAGSAEKVARLREWGADVAVDYTSEDFVAAVMEATAGRGVEIVLESVGGDVLGATFDAVAPAGRIISMGASSGRSTNRFRLQTLFEKGISVAGYTLGVWVVEDHPAAAAGAAALTEFAARGEIDPVIARVFPPEEIAEAHRFLQGRHSIGRTVVKL